MKMEKNEMEKTADKLKQMLFDGDKAYSEYCEGQRNCSVCPYGAEDDCMMQFLAEYFAENGVTV